MSHSPSHNPAARSISACATMGGQRLPDARKPQASMPPITPVRTIPSRPWYPWRMPKTTDVATAAPGTPSMGASIESA
jgi:hypothetical protein